MSGTPTNLVLLGVRAQSDLETYMHSVGVQGINSIVEGASKKITFLKGFTSHDAFGSHPVRTFRHLNQNEECILIIRHTNPATPEPQELCRLINIYLSSNLSHLNRSKGYMIDIFAGSQSDIKTACHRLPASPIADELGLTYYDHATLSQDYFRLTNIHDTRSERSLSSASGSQFLSSSPGPSRSSHSLSSNSHVSMGPQSPSFSHTPSSSHYMGSGRLQTSQTAPYGEETGHTAARNTTGVSSVAGPPQHYLPQQSLQYTLANPGFINPAPFISYHEQPTHHPSYIMNYGYHHAATTHGQPYFESGNMNQYSAQSLAHHQNPTPPQMTTYYQQNVSLEQYGGQSQSLQQTDYNQIYPGSSTIGPHEWDGNK